MLFSLVLAALDFSQPAEGRARVVLLAESPTPLATLSDGGSDQHLCDTPCVLYLPPGAFAAIEGGAGSDFVRELHFIWVPENGAVLMLHPVPRNANTRAIVFLSLGIPLSVAGVVFLPLALFAQIGDTFAAVFGVVTNVGVIYLAAAIGTLVIGTVLWVSGVATLHSAPEAPTPVREAPSLVTPQPLTTVLRF
jgi:hypothetical protein